MATEIVKPISAEDTQELRQVYGTDAASIAARVRLTGRLIAEGHAGKAIAIAARVAEATVTKDKQVYAVLDAAGIALTTAGEEIMAAIYAGIRVNGGRAMKRMSDAAIAGGKTPAAKLRTLKAAAAREATPDGLAGKREGGKPREGKATTVRRGVRLEDYGRILDAIASAVESGAYVLAAEDIAALRRMSAAAAERKSPAPTRDAKLAANTAAKVPAAV